MRGGICVAGGGMKRRRSAVGTSQVRGQNVAGGTAESYGVKTGITGQNSVAVI